MKQRKVLLPIITGAIMVGAIALSAQGLHAEGAVGDYPPIAQKIADKFGINVDEVYAVFNEAHFERLNDRLEQLVSDGKITVEQKNLISAKLADIKSRQQFNHQELREWATENNIDPQYLFGSHMGPHMGKGFWRSR